MDSLSLAGHAATQLHTVSLGKGEDPLLFIHGWSCQASDWDETLSALKGERPVMAIDLPGHGKSAHVEYEDATMIGLAKVVVAAAREAGINHLGLVGHSMGGVVALEAARLWAEQEGQEQLNGVVLVDTFGLPYGDMDAQAIASIETPFQQDFVGAMHFLVDNTTAKDLNPAARAQLKLRMASADPQRMLPMWSDLLRWSPQAAFAELRCPIHAINGEHIPESAQKRCAPYVRAQVLPGSRHFPQFEQPQAFLKALKSVLPAR